MNSISHNILEGEDLMSRARELTGIDLIDEEAVEPITRLVNSINEEADLHEIGCAAKQKKLLRILSNRLRMQRDIANHPEILDQKINAPIFIHGMPRTGSTKSQKILSKSGDFNWLVLWMTLNPSLITGSRDESTKQRIDEGLEFEDFFEQNSPENKVGHQFLAMEPEEDSFILEHSLVTNIFPAFAKMDAYVEWAMSKDIRIQFTHLRDTLKYLQWQGLADESKRWILKCPMYYGLEHELLDIFPDAYLVMTHRDPKITLASSMKLLTYFYKPFSNRDIQDQVPMYLHGQAESMERHLAIRKEIPELKIIDIDYKEMADSAETAIEKIYNFCGMDLQESSKNKMLAWDSSNPRHKKGKHEYSLETYGLTAEIMDEVYSEYLNHFKEKFNW
ncbi:MAG: sulfotransferase [SAR86 cluster bacterium]|jgi:hypothetical protein|nr:sulfotransferase [SAR86 cluster bacterium]